MRLIAPLLLLLLMFSGAASATDYYVATWGDNTTQGNITHPWQNVSYATQQAVAGDTIHLFDGTWNGENCTFANSGSSGSNIVVCAYNGTPTLSNPTGSGRAFYGDCKKYISIRDITIDGYHYGIYFYGGNMYDFFINNVTIKNTGSIGIYLYSYGMVYDSIVSNCALNNIGSIAICPIKCFNSTFSYNNIDGTGAIGIGSSSRNYKLSVMHNIINNTGTHGISFFYINDTAIGNNTVTNISGGWSSIRLDYNCDNTTIHDNILTNDGGVQFYPNTLTIFKNNSLTDSGLKIDRCRLTPIFNNTFENSRVYLTEGAGGYTIVDFYDNVMNNTQFDIRRTANTTIRNNVFRNTNMFFYHTVSAPSSNITIRNNVYTNITGTALAIDEPSGAVDGVYIRNNIFYNVSGNCIHNHLATNVSVAYNCIYENATSAFFNITDTNTLYSDPLFADPVSDCHLESLNGRWDGTTWVYDASDSPCIDAGDTSDGYSNETLPSGFRINIGAYGNTDKASKSFGTCYNLSSQIECTITSSGRSIFDRVITEYDTEVSSGSMQVTT